jgi:Protein of unknown function (DUF3467)
MPEQTEQSDKANDVAAPVPWIPDPEGIGEIYSNLVHLNWTLYDVRIRFGQVIPNPAVQPDKAGWAVLEYAAATIPWGQAKILRDMLAEAVHRYEALNGEIAVPKLPT